MPFKAVDSKLCNGLRLRRNKPRISKRTQHLSSAIQIQLTQRKIFMSSPMYLIFIDSGGFIMDEKLIHKGIIEELVSQTIDKSDLSVAYKISASNLNVRGAERQKVKLAAKLFSHTISQALIRAGNLEVLTSENWLKCSDFFKQVNDWFDCLNVRSPFKDSRERVQGVGLSESLQFGVIDKMSETILNMRVKGKSTMMPFQKGILMTNNSLKQLYGDLKSKPEFKYLLTYRLNQDVLENFFGVIRSKGGLHDHPDRLEFMYRIRSYILRRNEGSLSTGGNTMVDDTPDMEIADNLTTDLFGSLDQQLSPQHDAEELESLQYDGLEHLAGYICKRVKDPALLVDQLDTSFTWTDQLSEGFLHKPNDKMMADMQKMKEIFNTINGEEIVFCPNYLYMKFHY